MAGHYEKLQNCCSNTHKHHSSTKDSTGDHAATRKDTLGWSKRLLLTHTLTTTVRHCWKLAGRPAKEGTCNTYQSTTTTTLADKSCGPVHSLRAVGQNL